MEELRAGDPQRIGAHRLLGRLGAGGMGLVYLARSERGRTVAVKLVRQELAAREEFRDRFRQEVLAARRVGGQWTAPVLDADTEAPLPWVATGYIAGPSLRSVVGEHGPLPERSVRVLAAGLASALTDIHAAGIVHRDLKPSNVLVTIDGPRVIDFGIARALQTVTDGGLTRTGAVIGSPGFMAPEQVRGERITPACDIFCLGSVLAYAATGRMPFGTADSDVHALMFRIAEEEPDLTGLPESLTELVADCLRKDPAARPAPEQLLERTGAHHTLGDGKALEPWLPGGLVAQLGRHAVRLLDAENPDETAGAAPADAAPVAAATGAAGAAGAPGPAAAAGVGPAGAGPADAVGADTPRPASASAPGPAAAAGVGPAGPAGAGTSGVASAGTPGPAGAGAPGPAAAAGAGPAGPAGAGTSGVASAGAPGPASAGAGAGAAGGVGQSSPEAPTAVQPLPPAAAPTAGGGVHALPTAVPASVPPPPLPQPGQPAPPYGYGQTPPYGATPPYGSGHHHTGAPGHLPPYSPAPYNPRPPGQGAYYGPDPAQRSQWRTTVLVIAVALVVAIGGGAGVYALMRGGGTEQQQGQGRNQGDGRTGGEPVTESPGTPSAGTSQPAPSQGPSSPDGGVPAEYLGTWETAFGANGTDVRRFTLAQGGTGETVFRMTAEGAGYHCEFSAALSSSGPPLELGPSSVDVGPATSCKPGPATVLELNPDGTLTRTFTDGSGEALTYDKVG